MQRNKTVCPSNQEKKQATEITYDCDKMSVLSKKQKKDPQYCKVAIINIITELKETMFEISKKDMTMILQQILIKRQKLQKRAKWK